MKRSKWLRLWTPKTALIKDRNLFLVNTIEPLQCRQINLCHYGYDVDGQLDQEGCITLISFTHGDEDIYIRNIGEREYFESLKAIICARCQYFGQLYKSINILLPYSFHGIGSFRQYNESQTLLTSYSGEHVYGINTGQGVYRIYDSAINSDVVTFEYNGEFLNGERNGFGCAIWPHNIYVNCYTGAWKNNRKHGIGIEKYYGTKYEGHWISDLRHGIGTLTNIFDKNVYHGKWEQGELTEGELRFYDGASRYEGNFLHFVPSGMGTFFYSNGDTYNGDVCEGKRLGKGLYTHGIYQLHGEWISHGTMRGNIYTDDKIIKTDIHVVLVNDVCNGRVITLDLISKALYIGSLSELASLNHCKTIQYNGQIESIHEEMLHYYNGEENIAFVTQVTHRKKRTPLLLTCILLYIIYLLYISLSYQVA